MSIFSELSNDSKFEQREGNLYIRDALILCQGQHKPEFNVTEGVIRKIEAWLKDNNSVPLFLSHDEKELNLVGIATDFSVKSFENKPAIFGTLVISDTMLAEKLLNLRQLNAKGYGISPKIQWTKVEANQEPLDPIFDHVAIVLNPAQGEATRLDASDMKQITCPKCKAKIEPDEDEELPEECPKCGTDIASEHKDEVECPKCKQKVKPGKDGRCPECASFLPSKHKEEPKETKCPKCGEKIEEVDGKLPEKCPKCGALIKEAEHSGYDDLLKILEKIDASKKEDVEKAIAQIKELLKRLKGQPKGARPKDNYPKIYAPKYNDTDRQIVQLRTPEEDFQPSEPGANIYRVPLFRVGNFVINKNPTTPLLFRATKEVLQQVVDNFKNLKTRVPVFVGHPKHNDSDLPKTVGWLIDLSLEEDKLYGVLEFVVKEVADAVASKKIRGCSVGFDFNYRTPEGERMGTVLEHIALTVYPKLKELLGQDFEKLESFVASEDATIVEAEAEEFNPSKEKLDSFQFRILDLEKKLKVLFEKYEAEKKKTQSVEKERLNALLDAAISDGRISPAQRPIFEGVAKVLMEAGTVRIGGEDVPWLEALQRHLLLSRSIGRLEQDFLSEPQSGSGGVSFEKVVGMSTEEFLNFLSGGKK